MIVQEHISDTLIRTYSDSNVYIHGGYPEADYEDAVDPISTKCNGGYIRNHKCLIVQRIM